MPKVTVHKVYPDGSEEYVEEEVELPPPPPPPPPTVEERVAAILRELAQALQQGVSPTDLAALLDAKAQEFKS